MSGSIKHRHQTVIVPSGADVDTNEWNDSHVLAGGSDGQAMIRDSSQADGWKLANVTTRGAFGSRAVADGKQGIYFPTDGYTMARDNGASFDPMGPMFQFTSPTDPGTSDNQGSSTISSGKDAIEIVGAAAASGANVFVRYAAHAAPFTLTAYMICNILTRTSSGGFNGFGLAFRESSTGRLSLFGTFADASGNMVLRAAKYTTSTSFSADYNPPNNPRTGEVFRWYRIADDGINRISSVSVDGQNWQVIHTITRLDFLTTNGGDQQGLFISVENTTTPNWAPVVNVLSLTY